METKKSKVNILSYKYDTDIIPISGENFKFIPGFKKYLSSESGKVYSLVSKKMMNINIERFKRTKKAPSIGLQDNNCKKKQCYLSRLIAITWIPNPYNKPEVNHIDADCYNNCVSNLEWVTKKENTAHAKSLSLSRPHKPFGRKVIKCDEKTGKELEEFDNIHIAAQSVGIIPTTIDKALAGKLKRAAGFVWKYKAQEEIYGEVWKDLIIDGINTKYKVSDKGRFKNKNGILLNGFSSNRSGGYRHIELRYKNNGIKVNVTQSMHRLIALTFIPNPLNKPFVDHIDTNPGNNQLSNLRWCTQKENMNNANTTCKIKKSVQQWSKDGKILLNTFQSIKDAKKFMNENFSAKCEGMIDVCKNRRKTANGFVWKYTDYSMINESLRKILNTQLIAVVYGYL